MTPDESAILAAILANPGDDLPRLVFADWLDEHDQPERAEFIRVQCELADIERERTELFNEETDWSRCDTESGISASWCPNCGDCSCPGWEKNDHGCPLHSPESRHCCLSELERRADDLRKREWELWHRLPTAKVFAPCVGGIATDPDDTQFWLGDRSGPLCLVRRGFVAEVRCPLATLFGGPCPGCIEPGELDDGDSRCRLCKGSGHTPGIAGGLFRAQPIERVILTDREPWEQSVAPRYAGWWQESPYHQGTDVLPDELLRYMDDHPKRIDHGVAIRYRRSNIVRGGCVLFASRAAALDALSAACVAWGRELAGIGVSAVS